MRWYRSSFTHTGLASQLALLGGVGKCTLNRLHLFNLKMNPVNPGASITLTRWFSFIRPRPVSREEHVNGDMSSILIDRVQ
jgi:hypothetical protein